MQRIENRLMGLNMPVQVLIDHSQSRLVNMIYEQGKVTHCEHRSEGTYLEAVLPLAIAKKILTQI